MQADDGRGECKTVRKAWIEDLIAILIKSIVHDDDTVNEIANLVMELQGKKNTMLSYLNEQLAEVNNGIDNLVNAIQMGICNAATKKRMDELEARKTELEIEIAKEEIGKPKLTRDQVCCYLHHFRTFDTNKFEHRRKKGTKEPPLPSPQFRVFFRNWQKTGSQREKPSNRMAFLFASIQISTCDTTANIRVHTE